MLIADQVQAQRSHAGPVLRRRADRVREPGRRLMAAGTATRVRAMLAGAQADLGQIEHLTGEMPDSVTV